MTVNRASANSVAPPACKPAVRPTRHPVPSDSERDIAAHSIYISTCACKVSSVIQARFVIFL